MFHYRLGPPLDVRMSPSDGVVVRVGENALRSVVFFGIETEKGPAYGGTGFLLADFESGISIPVLVTARHVAEFVSRIDQFFVRANAPDGRAIHAVIRKIEWVYPNDEDVDLAIASLSLYNHQFQVLYLELRDGFLVDRFTPNEVAPGDFVSLVGLFRLHHGKERHIPFVHTGNISVLPDPKERVPMRNKITGKLMDVEAYLIEAQTLDGLSGSPVFVHRPIDLQGFVNPKTNKPVTARAFNNEGLKLLGVYAGAWDGEPGEILAKDRSLSGNVRVPVGVGMVVPADKILELVRGSKMKKFRDERVRRERERLAATTDSAFSDPPASDENPTHREDFTRLLGAAVRKPEQED